MDRMKQQIAFLMEIDKVKISSDRHILRTESERRTMRNIRGIWQSQHFF